MKSKLLILALLLVLTGCTAQDAVSVNVTNPGAFNPVVIQGVTDAGNNQTVLIDTRSHALAVIDVTHDALHDGTLFGYSTVQNITGSGNLTFLIIPSASHLIHFSYTITTDAEASLDIYEASNVSDNGTPVTPLNHDRTSSNLPMSSLFVTPTITSLGPLLTTDRWGAGKQLGGGISPAEEWLLAPGKTYIIRITNQTVSSQYVALDFFWYRHD